jgi:hypothetical protein
MWLAMLHARHFFRAATARRATPVRRSHMAKTRRRYSRGASRDVESEMRRYNRGTARSGRGGKGGKVKSRKQAIAIGLSQARKEGKRVPRKKATS